jgi:hypothetical protein
MPHATPGVNGGDLATSLEGMEVAGQIEQRR